MHMAADEQWNVLWFQLNGSALALTAPVKLCFISVPGHHRVLVSDYTEHFRLCYKIQACLASHCAGLLLNTWSGVFPISQPCSGPLVQYQVTSLYSLSGSLLLWFLLWVWWLKTWFNAVTAAGICGQHLWWPAMWAWTFYALWMSIWEANLQAVFLLFFASIR